MGMTTKSKLLIENISLSYCRICSARDISSSASKASNHTWAQAHTPGERPMHTPGSWPDGSYKECMLSILAAYTTWLFRPYTEKWPKGVGFMSTW